MPVRGVQVARSVAWGRMEFRGGAQNLKGTLGAISHGWVVFRAVTPAEGEGRDLRSRCEGPGHLGTYGLRGSWETSTEGAREGWRGCCKVPEEAGDEAVGSY